MFGAASKIAMRLRMAMRRGLGIGGMVMAIMVMAQSAGSQPPPEWRWDVAKWDAVSSGTLLPGSCTRLTTVNTTHRDNSPQYFTLYGKLAGYGASQGNPSVCGFVLSGKDSATALYPDWDDGDTLWFIARADSIGKLGRFARALSPAGGDWMSVWLVNQSTGDTVLLDSAWVWKKH